MGPEEYLYTRFCSTAGDDYDGYDDTSYPHCILDPLWWARPLTPASVDAGSDDLENDT